MHTLHQHRLLINLSLLIVVFISGCASIKLPEQTYHNNYVPLDQENPLGQSFVARFDGLNGFIVNMTPEFQGKGDVILSLSSSPFENEEIIDQFTIPISEINQSGYHFFKFKPQKESTNHYYYISLEVSGESSVTVNIDEGNAYLNGALYSDGFPQDAQMTFKLSYDLGLLCLGMIEEALNWLVLLLVGLWLFIIPGWALLSLALGNWSKTHWSIKIGLSGGVSLAAYPVIFLWSDLIGLHFGELYAWLLPVVGLIILFRNNYKAFRQIVDRNKILSEQKNAYIQHLKSQIVTLPNLVLLFIIGLIIVTRLWAVRNLDMPMWGDSYQHTMIVQLLLDHNGLFQSWDPYTSLESFSYHFGFHANAAVFSWLTGKSAAEAVLWSGQIVNVIAVLTLIPIAVKIGKSPWAGVFSLLIGGLLIEMPAYYVNWGRYTQLTGQAILLTVVFYAWILLEQTRLDWKILAVNWLVAAGLALTHYRVVIFGILFLPAFWLLNTRRENQLSFLRKMTLYGLGAGILFLPWLFKLSKGKILDIFKRQVTIFPQDAGVVDQTIRSIGSLDQYLPIFVWGCFFCCLGWLLWKKNRGVAIIGTWWFLNLLFTNPGWFGLPGSGVISNFALFISAYIPASLIIAIAASAILLWKKDIDSAPESGDEGFSRLSPRLMLTMCLIIGLSLWGALQLRKVADPHQYALATRPDLIAAEWINENTSDDARFLINSFSAFKNTEAAGSDGGWWLPLLSNRQTFITPITSGFEQVDTTQNSTEVEIVKAIETNGVDDVHVLKLLAEQGLTHVYIGQRQGMVNTDHPLLEIEMIKQSPFFQERYHQDLVWVFEIQYATDGQ